MSRNWKKRGQRGYALVVVILVLLMVSYLSADLGLNVRTELKVATNVKERTEGRFLARAGLVMAQFRRADTPQNSIGTPYEKFLEGYPYEEHLSEKGRFRYVLVSESGKIDLNRFPEELMRLFLAYHGIDENDAAVILDSLQDWRDPDDLHRLNGAESDYYETLDDPYIPRNGRIGDPAEFFLIKGTEPLRGKFNPYAVFTVYNNKSQINFNSMTPEMLEFVAGGDQEIIDAYRQAQEEMPGRLFNIIDMQNILGTERYSQMRLFVAPAGTTTNYYYIEAIGEPGYRQEEVGDGQAQRHWPGLRIEAIYQWQGNKAKYLFWKESFS